LKEKQKAATNGSTCSVTARNVIFTTLYKRTSAVFFCGTASIEPVIGTIVSLFIDVINKS
jgi:hypothetical protein